NSAAALRHVAGFPDLGLLRRLRPTPNRSADGAPSPPPRRTHGLRQERSGSRVHSLIAGRRRHPTLPLRHRRGYNPQHVTTASPSAPNRHPQEFPTTPTEVGARRLDPYPPGLSRCRFEGRVYTGFSRIPFRLARRARTIW